MRDCHFSQVYCLTPSLIIYFNLLPPVFQKLSGEQAVLQKLTWLLANLVGLGLALCKFHAMGLLPTSPSDWPQFMEARRVSPRQL